jgi:hypothetical protein
MALRRLTVKFLNGTQFEFDGEPEECIAFGERLARMHVEVTIGSVPSERSRDSTPTLRETGQKRASRSNAIGIREMRAAFKRAEPRNDAERVGVIVAVAHTHEQTPVDIAFLREWFEKLGLRQPSAMSATVGNARKDGLITSVAYGQFAPTARARVLVGESTGNVVQMRRRAG